MWLSFAPRNSSGRAPPPPVLHRKAPAPPKVAVLSQTGLSRKSSGVPAEVALRITRSASNLPRARTHVFNDNALLAWHHSQAGLVQRQRKNQEQLEVLCKRQQQYSQQQPRVYSKEAMLIRHVRPFEEHKPQRQQPFNESLFAIRRVAKESEDVLGECDNLPAKFFRDGRNWDDRRERMAAARALLVVPTRALAKLLSEAKRLESSSSSMESELVNEGERLREAGKKSIELIYSQLGAERDAVAACLASELHSVESWSARALQNMVQEERQARAEQTQQMADLAAKLDAARTEIERMQAEKSEAEIASSSAASLTTSLRNEIARLNKLCMETEAQAVAQAKRLELEHSSALAELDAHHRRINAEQQLEINRLHKEKDEITREAAATKIAMAARLQIRANLSRQDSDAAFIKTQEMRNEKVILERIMEREKDVALKREADLLKEKERKDAQIRKLQRIQEQALGVKLAAASSAQKMAEPIPARARAQLYWEILRARDQLRITAT